MQQTNAITYICENGSYKTTVDDEKALQIIADWEQDRKNRIKAIRKAETLAEIQAKKAEDRAKFFRKIGIGIVTGSVVAEIICYGVIVWG